MAGLIPQTFIDELIERCDIVSIISEKIALKKKGANFVAPCPFHHDKTPSFVVSPVKQIYHCFGCSAGGNLISFLMHYDQLNFVETVEYLAHKIGLSVPQDNTNENSEEIQERKQIILLLRGLTDFYQVILWKSQEGQNAFAYLNQRGIRPETIKDFKLGYAPKTNGHLDLFYERWGKKHFPKQEIFWHLLERAGVIVKKQGGYQTRFFERIIFPICDKKGDVIAFGGRAMAQQHAKYLNSPDTPVFHKGHELYNFHRARGALSKNEVLYVVEGYMDVIQLEQYGIQAVVAALGTAVTASHLKELIKVTREKEIIFCFDGDLAGQNAAWRTLLQSLPVLNDGIIIRFMFLPENEDPDSFLKKYGVEKFKSLINQVQPLTEFFFKHLETNTPLNSAENRAKFNRDAKALLAKMPDSTLKQLMEKDLATKVGLSLPPNKQTYQPQKIENKYENKYLSKKPKKRLSPAFLAIALLIQNPDFKKYLVNYPLRFDSEIEGMSLLSKIIDTLHKYEKITTGSILEYWREQPEYKVFEKLAFMEHMIPESGIDSEFIGTLVLLQKQEEKNQIHQLIELKKAGKLSEQQQLDLLTLLKKSANNNSEN